LTNNQLYLKIKGGSRAALLCFALLSCNQSDKVAQVNDKVLHRDDAELMMKEMGYNIDDSLDWRQFVEDWVNCIAFSEELKNTQPKQEILSNIRSDIFKGELAEYYLCEGALNRTTDTLVADRELKEYYDEHNEEFILQDFIVKALFIKVPLKAKVAKQLKTAYLLKNDKDIAEVLSYAKLYAVDFYFDDENWILFQKIESKIPMISINKENLILNRTKTYLVDDEYIYFLNILDFKFKSDPPPFDFIKQQIEQRIVAQRLNAKRQKVSQQLLKKIYAQHEIKINL
jgi:hypothetical protein